MKTPRPLSITSSWNVSEVVKGFMLFLTRADFVTIAKLKTLISKRLSVENKAKLSLLTKAHFVTIAKLTH